MKPQRRVLITAGPTREPIDPVRFISNASSGKQGVALAAAALARGWQVDLVHGPIEVAVPKDVSAHRVTTTHEMLECCQRLYPLCDVLIAAAAVCDFRPRSVSERKRKRGATTWSLELLPTEDILATLGKQKDHRILVGFALESDDLEKNAAEKLERKNLDWVVANEPQTIGASSGRYLLLGKDGTREELGSLTKESLAQHVVSVVASDLNRKRNLDQNLDES